MYQNHTVYVVERLYITLEEWPWEYDCVNMFLVLKVSSIKSNMLQNIKG